MPLHLIQLTRIIQRGLKPLGIILAVSFGGLAHGDEPASSATTNSAPTGLHANAVVSTPVVKDSPREPAVQPEGVPTDSESFDQRIGKGSSGTFWDTVTNDFSHINDPVPGRPVMGLTDQPPVDPALRTTSDLITNSAISIASAELEKGKPEQLFKDQLAEARQYRAEQNYERAARLLVKLMESEAPDEIKRSAMLELALTAQQDRELVRAQQIFSQYVRMYPEDVNVPEVLLRQGLIYRQMGAPSMALTKFYSLMTMALNFKAEHLDYYQRLVLHAQTEIADTYYLQGRYEDAAEFFQRLLKLDARELKKSSIQYKLVRSLSYLDHHTDVVTQAQDFLARYTEAPEQPEVRFLLSTALKKLGRNRDALQQVLLLLQSQQASARANPGNWFYWQQRTGNEIANQLFKEGDYANALEVYMSLVRINAAAAWQVPVLYQIGLVYERLGAPPKAAETYASVIAYEPEVSTNGTPSLKAIIDMAKWRKDYLGWHSQVDEVRQTLLAPRVAATTAQADALPPK